MSAYTTQWVKKLTRVLVSVFTALNNKTRGPLSCIAHLSAEDMLKSAVNEEKKFKNIESE